MSNQLGAATRLGAIVLLIVSSLAEAAVSGATRLGNFGTNLFATHAPGEPGRLYLAGRSGTVNVLDLATNTLSATPYLSIPGVSTSGEGGLLGIAFHPEYLTNGKFYASYTVAGGSFGVLESRIVEYTRSTTNPAVADLMSARQVIAFSQPQNNHNGGWIGFSPVDNYLYMASGDGGGSNDTGTGHTSGTGNSQDITSNLLGKFLRLDINGDDFPTDNARNYSIPATNPFVGVTGDDEIWNYGVRNPWRNSFDRQTGELWIADVGQGAREEVNREPAGAAGRNYGWRLREGTIATPTSGIGGAAPPGAIDPVYEYTRGMGTLQGESITGGYVYRGPDPTAQGWYYFADFNDSNYWRFNPSNPAGTVQNINTLLFGTTPRPSNPASFAEDAAGNLYILAIGGDLWRINTNALVAGDYNGDGVVNNLDYDRWVAAYGASETNAADGNADGVVDAADYVVWRDNLGATAQGTPPAAPASSVPEPAAAGLIATLLATLSARSRWGGAKT